MVDCYFPTYSALWRQWIQCKVVIYIINILSVQRYKVIYSWLGMLMEISQWHVQFLWFGTRQKLVFGLLILLPILCISPINNFAHPYMDIQPDWPISYISSIPTWIRYQLPNCPQIERCFDLLISILSADYSSIFRSNGTAQKMKFYIEDFYSKCDQIRSFLKKPLIPQLLKKSLMENFIFCAVRSFYPHIESFLVLQIFFPFAGNFSIDRWQNYLTHFSPMHPFSTPWKHQKTAFWCFQVLEKRYIGSKWINNPQAQWLFNLQIVFPSADISQTTDNCSICRSNVWSNGCYIRTKLVFDSELFSAHTQVKLKLIVKVYIPLLTYCMLSKHSRYETSSGTFCKATIDLIKGNKTCIPFFIKKL